jgi:hypothetical protein
LFSLGLRSTLRKHAGVRLADAWRKAACAASRFTLPALLSALCGLSVLPAPAQASSGSIDSELMRGGASQPGRAQGAVSIRVRPGGWGAADPREIAQVLSFVADLLAPAFPRHAGDVIDISYRREGPVTLLERLPDGAYRMYLTVQDTRWEQFTYQFAHEYCHIVTNAEQRSNQDAAVRGTQWFEESLCEAVALLALEGVGARWDQRAPVVTVPGYAGAFHRYAELLLNQAHRRLPPGTSADAPLENWYLANRAALEVDPYQRAKNEVVANVLYTWLRGSQGALESIGYIGVEGLQSVGEGQAFAAYFERWRAASPERLRGTVTRVPALFGVARPGANGTRLVGR